MSVMQMIRKQPIQMDAQHAAPLERSNAAFLELSGVSIDFPTRGSV
jgi:hypothetical protein